MKVSTTLEKIEFLKQQEQQERLNEKEERQTKKDYLQFIKETSKFYVDEQFINSYDINITYNYILNNINKFITKIEEETREESENHFKIIATMHRENNNDWSKGTEKKLYLWDNFDILEDIENIFIKVLNDAYKKEQLKEKAKQAQLKRLLYNNIYNVYNDNNDYTSVTNFLYQQGTRDIISDKLSENEQEKEIIKKMYFKTCEEVKREFKTYNKEQEQPAKQEKKGNFITRHPGAILTGSVMYGLFRGLFKASKK